MAKENLRLLQPNVVRIDGYFYHIPDNADVLYKKTDDGTNAYSFALDTGFSNPVTSIEFDGRWFWTLENTATYDSIVKRWQLDDFILKLDRTYTLTSGSFNFAYEVDAFTVEHFEVSLDAVASSGTNSLTLSGSSFDRLELGSRLFLGPSTFGGFEGRTEQVIVASVGPGFSVTLTSNLQYTYNINDTVVWSDKVWLFNNFRQGETVSGGGNGALLSFNIHDSVTTVLQRDIGAQFKSATASTFLKDPQDNKDYLVYAVETNLLFTETQETSANFLSNVKSAAQNNQEEDTSTIPIFEITSENNTLFRLQKKATFNEGGTIITEVWDNGPNDPEYNYQLSTLTRIPQSISLTADPAIIAADALSTSQIKAIVRDQFDSPVNNATVQFSDDDTTGSSPGFVSPTSNTTNSNGETDTTYTSGDTAALVTITAQTKGA